MAAYPSILTVSTSASYPFGESVEFKTLISSFESGVESRKQKYTYPRRNLSLVYPVKETSVQKTLWEFYLARKGSFEAFNLFYPYSASYSGEYVDSGDGATVIFNLPCKTASAYVLYADGNVLTGGGTDYTFGGAGGADGADKVTMTVAPNAGVILTWDFTGYLKIHCRFAEDIYSYEMFAYNLFRSGLKIKGLLNK
jgi:hypothetical protein